MSARNSLLMKRLRRQAGPAEQASVPGRNAGIQHQPEERKLGPPTTDSEREAVAKAAEKRRRRQLRNLERAFGLRHDSEAEVAS